MKKTHFALGEYRSPLSRRKKFNTACGTIADNTKSTTDVHHVSCLDCKKTSVYLAALDVLTHTAEKKIEHDEVPPCIASTESVESSVTSTSSAAETAQKASHIMSIEFVRSTKPRKTRSLVYTPNNGGRGSIKVSASLFDNPPQNITVNAEGFAEPKAKLTKEERAAKRKAMTPEQRIEAAKKRVESAQRRLQKMQEATLQPAAATV